MRKPLILISAPGLLKRSYCNYLEWVGPAARLITPGAKPPGRFSGLVLAGGGDLHPRLYGGEPSLCEEVDEARDRMEFELLDRALSENIPVLGICRGIQVLNVFLGGTLLEDVPGHKPPGRKGDTRHEITLEPGTRLYGILGTMRLEVNSAHHQALGEIAKDLVVSARAGDGTVEGVELRGEGFVMGVQWHPERDKQGNGRYRESSVKIREAFLEAIKGLF